MSFLFFLWTGAELKKRKEITQELVEKLDMNKNTWIGNSISKNKERNNKRKD